MQAPLNENSRPNRLDGLADSGLHGGLGTGNDGPNRLVPTPQPDHEEHRRAEDQSTDEDDVRTKLPDRRAPQITPHPQIWNWKKGPQLGNGSFGTVYLGINSDTGGLMAVKQVHVLPLYSPVFSVPYASDCPAHMERMIWFAGRATCC